MKHLVALAVIAAAPLAAQLAPPNGAGATVGHVHLNVTDIAAHQGFWSKLGGVPVHNDKLQMIQFPGVYIVLRKQDATGPSVGSNINHIGLHVTSVEQWVTKWKADGLAIEAGNNPKQVFLTSPDGVRVEILENATMPTPVAAHHIHMFVTDPLTVQAWYVKNFGAAAGKRGNFDTANMPGAELTLAKQEKAQIPIKGRALDHIGFEVKNLDEFITKLKVNGVAIEDPGIRNSANAPGLRIAFLVDPWGTYIELTQGLPPASGAQAASR